MSYYIVLFLIVSCIVALTFAFVMQLKKTIEMSKSNEQKKNIFIGNILCSIGLGGFVLSFILNVIASLEKISISFINCENTAILCWIFLGIFLLSKYYISPKKLRIFRKK